MTPLERAILVLAQHEDAHSDEPLPSLTLDIEDIRRFSADYARYSATARAVLQAIREPSDAMKRAGMDACGGDGSVLDGYEAMIDAALEEG